MNHDFWFVQPPTISLQLSKNLLCLCNSWLKWNWFTHSKVLKELKLSRKKEGDIVLDQRDIRQQILFEGRRFFVVQLHMILSVVLKTSLSFDMICPQIYTPLSPDIKIWLVPVPAFLSYIKGILDIHSPWTIYSFVTNYIKINSLPGDESCHQNLWFIVLKAQLCFLSIHFWVPKLCRKQLQFS